MTNLNTFDTEELIALSHAALERSDFDGALEKLKHVMQAPNPPADAVALSARLYAQLGLYARAEKLYRRYLEQNPKAIIEQFQLGLTQVGLGKANDALQAWENVLREDPGHIPTLYYKSLVFAQLGRLTEAKAILDPLLKAISVDHPYFNAAKQLLQAIHAVPAPSHGIGSDGVKSVGRPVGLDPYRTEKQ